MTQLDDAVRAMLETTTVDFKERLNWQSGRRAQIELLRDIAAFANRDGGIIVVGLRQVDATFELVGLQADDPMPDSTQIGLLLREYFDPTIEVNSGSATVDDVTYGYVVIPAFSLSPLIATRDGPNLANGDLLVRSDALATEKVKARDLRVMLDRAVTARGQAFAEQLPPRLPPPADDPTWSQASPGSRLLDASPVPAPPVRRLRDLEDLVQQARVISTRGSVFMPNDIDLLNGRVIRESGRIIAQTREAEGEEDVLTTAEVTDKLAVRLREAPWRRRDVPGPELDLTSLVVFVLTATMFVRRLYDRDGIEACLLRIGIARPIGVRLTVDQHAFWSGLSERYVGTSRTDVWTEREVNLRDISTPDQRRPFVFALLEELLDYFGMRVSPETFEGQMNYIATRGGIIDE